MAHSRSLVISTGARVCTAECHLLHCVGVVNIVCCSFSEASRSLCQPLVGRGMAILDKTLSVMSLSQAGQIQCKGLFYSGRSASVVI